MIQLRHDLNGWATAMLLMLIVSVLPHNVWAADANDETTTIDNKTYHILRNNDDWMRFIALVQAANGNEDVNAIMDADFTIANSAGYKGSIPYRGTFNGNGHTLNVNISSSSASYIAPFSEAKDYTIKNLHVTGTVNGGLHSTGLVGSSTGTNYIDNCWISVTVNSSATHIGGIIGHGHKGKHTVNNCLFDGKLATTASGNRYAGAIIAWEDGNTSNKVTNCLENGTYEGFNHTGLCYNVSVVYGNTDVNVNNWSYHNWGEMKGNVVGSTSASQLVSKLGTNNWNVVNNKAVPKMPTYTTEANLDFYDIIPGLEDGDDGTVKIPVSCDQVIKTLGVSYTDEDGVTKSMPQITLEKNSYFGYVKLPATEAHSDIKVTAKLLVGEITKTLPNGKDAVIHNPRMLTAEMLSDVTTASQSGAIELKWKVRNPKVNDVLDGDMFLIERSLTGKFEDFETIGMVSFESNKEEYLYKDSLFTGALQPEHIDKSLGIPLMRYRVLRASAKELWGIEHNPTVAYVQPQMATLSLLQPKDAKASWHNESERTVTVEWNYAPSDNSHNYVWDSRAEMKIEVQTFRHDGTLIDSITTKLTDEQIDARQVVLQLSRSCINYQLRLLVDGNQSPIGKGTSDLFVVIRNSDDFNAFAQRVNSGETSLNAILMGDVDMGKTMLGSEEKYAYKGNFNGNGYQMKYEYDGQNYTYNAPILCAPFRYIANGAVITNVHTTGTIASTQKYASGLVGRVYREGVTYIENCWSSLKLASMISNGERSYGGIVSLRDADNDAAHSCLYISNTLFDGQWIKSQFPNGFGGFVGWKNANVLTVLSNCYYNPSGNGVDDRNGSATFVRTDNNLWAVIQDCMHKETFGETQGKQSNTAPDNWCWENGHPKMVKKDFSTPISDYKLMVTIPSDKFYYENLGHIDKESLIAQTQQSSVVLSWKNVDEEPVDYYEVWRRDVQETEFRCIATQLTEMSYEDNTTSPVHSYIYYVRGANNCEGIHIEKTIEVEGRCVNTGMVEGYLRFADGSGIPGQDINITSKDQSISVTVTTDESGYFRKSGLPYFNGTETVYYAMPGLNGYKGGTTTVTFGTGPGENTVGGIVFVVEESVKFSGSVMYSGTSIPVQGVSFIVDNHEVHNGSGKVTTDHEGKFSFRILKDKEHSIRAVKDGHIFYQKGYFHEDDDTTKLKYNFTADKAGIYFYDDTRVKLIGRVAGGKDQGDIPLGNSLSRNNLGDDLQLVLTLEGDNASRLVWDVQNTTLKERDEVFKHKGHDTKYEYQTQVHTTLNRKVVKPDVHTGEYEVWLPPVKWKIQQITAKGYATLFQDGKTGDVIDLTDSLTEHTQYFTGKWKSADNKDVTSVDVNYHAQYSRIYHSPVIIEYKQKGYDNFDHFGEKSTNASNLNGDSYTIPLSYGVKKPNWPAGKKDSLEAVYTFGYPVFDAIRTYTLNISAVEKYYYNNNTKSDTIDVVKLQGGKVTIQNSMESSTHRKDIDLDEKGEGKYEFKPQQLPYSVTGQNALRTLTMTLLMDGTYYEATPLKGYIMSTIKQPGANDILMCQVPQLIDILRDPPGGGSSATLSKGSTLKYSYSYDLSLKGGINLQIKSGNAMTNWTAVVQGSAGYVTDALTLFDVSFDIITSANGKEGYSYTLTTNADISTSADKLMVGAEADVYIGVETSFMMTPSVSVRAIPQKMWEQLEGEREAGRLIEIAQGKNENGETIHLVRDETMAIGPKVTSTFTHSQSYIQNQLIPKLEQECKSLLFTGSKEEAQAIADSQGKIVYWSLRTPNDPYYGVVNTKKEVNNGDESWEYEYNDSHDQKSDGINYMIIKPASLKDNREDRIAEFSQAALGWASMIAQNEKEKLEANELVKTFDVDGGSPLTYSEEFSSEYDVSGYVCLPWMAQRDLGTTGLQWLANIIKAYFRSKNHHDNQNQENKKKYFNSDLYGYSFGIEINPVLDYSITEPYGTSTNFNRKESFTISMDKRSHLVFDVYRVKTKVDEVLADKNGDRDVFVNEKFYKQVDKVDDKLTHSDNYLKLDDLKKSDLQYARSFVYRTRGGATCRPYEGQRVTEYYNQGKELDAATKKIENPVIYLDKQSISGVPSDEPARFKIYMANESEQPEAAYPYFDLYQVENSNPHGAKLLLDGMPLSGNARTIEIHPGTVTEKTVEVWASEAFDYDSLKLRLRSQDDIRTFKEVQFSVHYLQTAGSVNISTPGDKWIMNTDAPYEKGKGWYMPVVISGFNKNQKNFDHIEFQYKESTRGDDYWTNLCGYYNDSTIYAAAAGTKEMIPENGNITTRFFGEGTVMEKAYDLRAVLFCRNGNGFLTNSSKVLSGVKDTRRPQLFGTPEPKDGILGAGDNIIFNFSEDIEYNYLQATTNFEVKGETNENSIQEAPSLQFKGSDYAQSEARRNFADKSVTIEVMVKPDETGEDMPVFSHGRDGKQLQLWVTKNKMLRVVVDDKVLETNNPISFGGFQRVALVLDNEKKKLSVFSNNLDASMENVTYSGYGPLIFGSTQQSDISQRKYYKGRMLQARVWNRAMDINLLNTYGNQLLTGYEMGLTDYYPMNEGSGDYATDFAQGAHLKLNGADWAQPRGMSLYIDGAEQRAIKGLRLKQNCFQRSSEKDYTLMFWFKTNDEGHGALLSNGSGQSTDVQPEDKFFIGFEGKTLKYRSNGREFLLGDSFSDDRWHHYAMTVNRAHQVATIYVDNDMKAQFATDSLGGMEGTDFYIGNMVWKEEGLHNDVLHQQNELTGYIDGLALFEQALPPTLIKRYTAKAIGGKEKGLITYVDFDRQERQKNGDITLKPFVLNKKVNLDKDGNEQHDSVFVDPIKTIENHVSQSIGAPMQAYEELRNLNFSYVGRDHQLLVNIDELDSRINKRTVYVTVNDIPDLNGNFMASPKTAAVFIDRNPLRWAQKTYKTTVQSVNNKDFRFDINIVNNSGASHTYSVTNMPKWLSVNAMTDVIEPKSEQILTFTIGKDTNVGTYDEIIYLTDENGLFEPLALNITVEGNTPAWQVNDDMKQFSMNIVARVQIGDDIVTDSRDIVGVFDETGRCMGVGNVNYNATSSESLTYLTVCDSTTTKKKLRFKLWHYETGKVMVLTPSKTIEFKSEGFEGTTKNPIILKATDQYVQTIELLPGWNWISLNVLHNDYRDLKTLLGKFKWQNNDQLTDETNNLSLMYYNGQWIANRGSSKLSDHRLNVCYSYRVKVSDRKQILLEGSAISSDGERTINVKKGWNSIGYTPLINLPVATALADYLEEAEEGDVIKNKTSFAMFSKGANGSREWKGNLKYMKPGEGYMLYRTREGNAQFIYPFYEANATFFEEGNQTTNGARYAGNMVMTATAEGIELQAGDKLIVYSDAEIRGESAATMSDTDSNAIFYLTIDGSQKAPLRFAIERDGDIIATTGDVMTYQNDAVSGTPEEPTKIDFTRSQQLPQHGWYTLQGIKLQSRPTQSGVYIYNGKKQVIK